MFKLYSGDGGGCFGAIPAYLNMAYDRVSEFDGYIGTSIHAALCAGYATGVPADDIYRFMAEDMKKVFYRSWWWAMKPYGPKWPDTGLNSAIKKLVGENTRLKDARKPLFITAMNFKHDRPKVFSSLEEEDKNLKLWEVIRCSVAANTYFPTWCPYDDMPDFFTDGGTWANTPSVAGLAALIGQLRLSTKEISIFSVGCGVSLDPDRKQSEVDNWGCLKMGLQTLDSMFEGGNEEAMSYMTKQFIGNRHVRFNKVPLESGWKMDNPSIIPELKKLTEPFVDEYKKILDRFLDA